jgi:flagellar biosynthesis anti-sigma factor FlgM
MRIQPQRSIAMKIQNPVARLRARPAFDAARVKQMKAAIAAGTFRVDAFKVADALIADLHEARRAKVH